MKLEEVQGTSKKTGKPFTGYVVKIGSTLRQCFPL